MTSSASWPERSGRRGACIARLIATGEVSIIVLPDDDDSGPAFLLYEKDGLVRLGIVSGDEWINDESFFGIQAAIDAVVAKAVSATTAGSTPAARTAI